MKADNPKLAPPFEPSTRIYFSIEDMKADEPRCTARTPAQETYFEQFERDMRAAAALGLTKERRSRKPVQS